MAVASGSRDLLESIEDAIKAFEGGCFSVDDLSVGEGSYHAELKKESFAGVDLFRCPHSERFS